MPISAPRPRPGSTSKPGHTLSPDAAGIVSFLLPGLGQIWTGERRKGALFIAVHSINLLAATTLMFSPWILKALDQFGQATNMRLNEQLSNSFMTLGFGSPASFLVAFMLFCFAAFAARDAFDHSAKVKREAIYHDYVLAMPEATSGSYIFHASLLFTALLLAFFLLIPPLPKSQITDIEFVQSEENTREKIVTKKLAEHNAKAAGKRDLSRPVEKASAQPNHQNDRPAHQTNKSPVKQALKAQETARTQEPPRAQEPKPPAPSLAPRPNLLTHAAAGLPAPAPAPATIKPGLPAPAPAPTTASVPATVPNPALHPLAFSHATPAAPSPVAIKNIAMGVPAPALPHAPVSTGAGGVSGAPNPLTVKAVTSGGTGGDSGQPSPVPVLPHSKSGSGSQGSSDPGGAAGPAPRPARSDFGPAGGGQHSSVQPRLINAGPGTGSNTNGGGGPRDGSSEEVGASIDWGPYMTALQRRIRQGWFPPHGPRSKRVKVIFTVHTNGEMTNLRLLTSSGMTIDDRAALKAVEDSAPFRPLPEHAPSSVDIEFTFDYNVFGGAGLR